jgi:hypothetical protein
MRPELHLIQRTEAATDYLPTRPGSGQLPRPTISDRRTDFGTGTLRR